jgi:hypothetical protein
MLHAVQNSQRKPHPIARTCLLPPPQSRIIPQTCPAISVLPFWTNVTHRLIYIHCILALGTRLWAIPVPQSSSGFIIPAYNERLYEYSSSMFWPTHRTTELKEHCQSIVPKLGKQGYSISPQSNKRICHHVLYAHLHHGPRDRRIGNDKLEHEDGNASGHAAG